MEQMHHHWLTEQRSKAIPEEEPTASVFAVEKLREMLEDKAGKVEDGRWNVEMVPERELQRAAIVVEKEAPEIFAKHSGRAAMLRVLGKEYFVKQISFHAMEQEPAPDLIHHPDSDHAYQSHG